MKTILGLLLTIATQGTLAAGPEYDYREIGVSKNWTQCENTREGATNWAMTALRNEAHERCEALGKGWTFDAILHGGYLITPECKNAPGKHFAKIEGANVRCKAVKKAAPKADKPEADKGGKASDERLDKDAPKKAPDSDKSTKKSEGDKSNKKVEADKTPREDGKKSDSKKSSGNAIDDAFSKLEKKPDSAGDGKNKSGSTKDKKPASGNSIDAAFGDLESFRKERETRAEPARPPADKALANREAAGRDKPETASARPAAAPDEMRPGKVFKDCADCPEMVVLPTGIAMGRTEVTQGQWKALMGNNPSGFKDCGDDCPVESVSWNDVQDYLKRLSAKTGKSYRLPKDAEWEAACLAGRSTTYCGGDDLEAVGWYNENSASRTHPVAQKRANTWGLYDMSGNVWEWQEDCWKGDCGRLVLRGGSWFNAAGGARASFRFNGGVGNRNGFSGFRPARMLP